jgi:hypothetical protein
MRMRMPVLDSRSAPASLYSAAVWADWCEVKDRQGIVDIHPWVRCGLWYRGNISVAMKVGPTGVLLQVEWF